MFKLLCLLLVMMALIFIINKSNKQSSLENEIRSTIKDSTNESAIVVAAGDIACGRATKMADCKQKETSMIVSQIKPDALLVLGDNQYENGELQDYLEFYNPTWGSFKQITHPVPGNHEYNTSDAKGYFDYFDGTGIEDGPAGQRGKGYYSFNAANWHIIALNSNCQPVEGCDDKSPQANWLKEDLKNNQRICTLAFWHDPRYSSGTHGIDETYRDFWQILIKYHADVIISAHDHLYERFSPQDSDGNLDDFGIVQFTVGTGGKSLYRVKNLVANSQNHNDHSFGVLKLTLRPQSYEWQFISTDGQFSDSGTADCVK